MQAVRSYWRKISGGPREKQALAFLRIAVGLFFVYAGHQKLVMPGFLASMSGTLSQWAADNPILPYKMFLEQAAVPQAELLGMLVTYGEIFIGFSYVFGFLVRFSSPSALFLNMNILLATQHTNPMLLSMNLMFIVIHAALFWGRSGQFYGFDRFVFQGGGKPGTFKPKGSKKLDAAKAMFEQNRPGKPKKKAQKKSKPF